jgi:hypothetical protein
MEASEASSTPSQSARPATVTIAGSYRKHLDRLLESAERFRGLGADVLRPGTGAVVDEDGEEDFVRLEGDPADAGTVHRRQLDSIDLSELLYVVNPGGYVGPSATANVAWAAKGGKLVVLAEPAYELVVATLAGGVGDEEYAIGLLKERQA